GRGEHVEAEQESSLPSREDLRRPRERRQGAEDEIAPDAQEDVADEAFADEQPGDGDDERGHLVGDHPADGDAQRPGHAEAEQLAGEVHPRDTPNRRWTPMAASHGRPMAKMQASAT